MMNQSKTKVRFLIKLSMLVPLFTGLSLMLGCEPASNESSHHINSADEMSIEIMEDNSLLVDQNPMTLDELENLLSELPESPGLVRMKVSPDAKFGVVTDVQSILKKYEAFKINYSSKKSNESSTELTFPSAPSDLFTEAERRKINEAAKAHQQKYQDYMNLNPETNSLEELRSAYDKVKETADEINRVFKEVAGDGEIPPPIKLGPKPEVRKKNK